MVTKPSYRPFEQTLVVTSEGQARVDADLTPVEEVTAASRVTESVEDAPSSVSIITGQELRAMGYPTIAEAVRGVRGVYVGDDTSYTNVGFRGFAQPGDYGDHVLILVDGMPTNDDYVGSSYVGYDARADIDDVERIEVVRGPGSVLYGTGAMFGVINLVTRETATLRPTARSRPSTADNSARCFETRAYATAQVRLSNDAGGWVSVSRRARIGPRLLLPRVRQADPATGGAARGVDWLRRRHRQRPHLVQGPHPAVAVHVAREDAALGGVRDDLRVTTAHPFRRHARHSSSCASSPGSRRTCSGSREPTRTSTSSTTLSRTRPRRAEASPRSLFAGTVGWGSGGAARLLADRRIFV